MSIKYPDDYKIFESRWYKGIDFDLEAELLSKELDISKKENDIQTYIKKNNKWFIPASIFECYDFGHHEAYLYSECPLGSEYRADYMLIGRNSLGYHIVLVEFEDVNVEYKLKTQNAESNAVRKGLIQINDWERWMDNNKRYFIQSMGLDSIAQNFYSWQFGYCLVVSRRRFMNEEANKLRVQREYNHSCHLKIISYDRLVDNVKRLCNGF